MQSKLKCYEIKSSKATETSFSSEISSFIGSHGGSPQAPITLSPRKAGEGLVFSCDTCRLNSTQLLAHDHKGSREHGRIKKPSHSISPRSLSVGAATLPALLKQTTAPAANPSASTGSRESPPAPPRTPPAVRQP